MSGKLLIPALPHAVWPLTTTAVRLALGAGAGQSRRAGCSGLCVCSLQGKQKYTLPLYHAMMGGSEAARSLARETFTATASQLHSNVVNYVQQIVVPKGS